MVGVSKGRVRLTDSAVMRSGSDRPTNRCMLKKMLAEWKEKWIWDHLDLIEGGDLAWLAEAFKTVTAFLIYESY